MLIQEFISRVNYQPSEEEWEQINAEYMASPFPKDKFCSDWALLNPEKAGRLKRDEARQKELARQYDNFVTWLNRVKSGKTPLLVGCKAVCFAAGLNWCAFNEIMRMAWDAAERNEISGFYLGKWRNDDAEISGCEFCPAGFAYYSIFEILSAIKNGQKPIR